MSTPYLLVVEIVVQLCLGLFVAGLTVFELLGGTVQDLFGILDVFGSEFQFSNTLTSLVGV